MTVNLKGMTDKQLNKRLTDLEITYLSCRDWWEQNTIKIQYQAVLDEKERRQMANLLGVTEEFIDEILDGLTPNTCRRI